MVNEIKTEINSAEFGVKHYSHPKVQFVKTLIDYWEKAMEHYYQGDSTKTKISPLEGLIIMLQKYTAKELMIITNFTMRNRQRILDAGVDLTGRNFQALKGIIEQWNKQIEDPYAEDSLQDLIVSNRFRMEIERELKLNNKSNSKPTLDHICNTYQIIAKTQLVRRIRKGASRNSGNLELADNILDEAWELWKNLDIGNNPINKEIISPGVAPTEHLDILIKMQFHLNNTRRIIPTKRDWEISLEDFYQEVSKLKENLKTPWANHYYWWVLNIQLKQAKIRKYDYNKFEKAIQKHKEDIETKEKKFIENIEEKQRNNKTKPQNQTVLIKGFQVLSEYQNKPSQRLDLTPKEKESRKRDIKNFLTEAQGTKATNRTSLFVDTKTMKIIPLDGSNQRFSTIPANTSSIIESVFKEIRYAKLISRVQESKNNYNGIIILVIVLSQLFMTLHILLGDSRITKQYRSKPSVWTSRRKPLEQTLSNEILADLIILLKDINRYLDRITQSRGQTNSPPQSDIYLLIETWIVELQKLEEDHTTKLVNLHAKFGEFLCISNPHGFKDTIMLYSLKSEIKDIKITIDDINLKPVGESSVD